MITETERKRIIDLIHQEVVPAIGCTEPIAVALCVAKATETLGTKPEKINVLLSANILKNAMGVGIPGTGMIGLPIAIALGALIGKSEYQLEVLKDSTPDVVEEGKRFIEEKRIHISLKENIEEKLYIEVCCEAGDDKATAVIAGGHTTFIYIERNGEVLFQKQHTASCEKEERYERSGYAALLFFHAAYLCNYAYLFFFLLKTAVAIIPARAIPAAANGIIRFVVSPVCGVCTEPESADPSAA